MDDLSKLLWIPEHKAGRVALWLSCVACFELSACVYADNGASLTVLFKYLYTLSEFRAKLAYGILKINQIAVLHDTLSDFGAI